MKQLIAVILSLALFCLLIPAVAEEASPAGTWYLKAASKDGADIQVVDPEGIVVKVNEDGTFAIIVGGVTRNGTWTREDSSVFTMALAEDDKTEFTLDGEELVFELTGTIVRMSRTPGEKPEGPAAVAAESADAFEGTWIPFAQLEYGLYAELSEEGKAGYATVQIGDGKVRSLFSNGEGGFSELAAYEASVADGKLTFEDSAFIPFKAVLTLLDDGTLLYETTMFSDDGESVTIGLIYVREAAAEEPAA